MGMALSWSGLKHEAGVEAKALNYTLATLRSFGLGWYILQAGCLSHFCPPTTFVILQWLCSLKKNQILITIV